MTVAPERARSVAPGLTTAEARRLAARHGPNVVATHRPVPVWRRVLAQLSDPMILVLLAAMVLTVATGDHADAVIIGFVVVANTAVGLIQELRADRAMAALSDLAAPTAKVRRDAQLMTIAAAEIVPGDVVVLAEGDVVPADGRLLEAVRLLVDESAMTGESEAVNKTLAADEHVMSAGTVVVRGRGVMEVTAIGADSALGRIAALVSRRPQRTPLQRRLASLGRVLAAVAAALSIVVFALGLLRGQSVELMAVTAVSLVVAAVPESLPAVVTLALALGARRMARHHAIVRRLTAVETLGSVTIVATDKTGTLTGGRMTVGWLWTPADGLVAPGGEASAAQHELLRAAALCNDARLAPGPDEPSTWVGTGDPTEVALLLVAAAAGVHRDVLDQELPRVAEVPFESHRRRMTTVHRHGSTYLVVTKGAPEVVLRVITDAAADAARAAQDQADQLSRDGYRVLAIAVDETDSAAVAEGRKDFRLLGLVAVDDPVRTSAPSTIEAFVRAGISPVIITGDHLATAQSVAARVGLRDDGSRRIYARTTPEEKLDIIRDLQAAGQVVAMTGDGVNDAPALRQADIGVAMGRHGTEVARQAADLVLADDELATLVTAVEEGRRAYDNVRRFLAFGLAGGAAEIAVMMVAPFFAMPLPLLPAQILWVNLLTHGLPGVAMGAEPADPAVLRRPPRPPAEPVLGAGLWQRILLLALVITAVTVSLGVWVHETGGHARTVMFFALGVMQFGVAIGLRPRLFQRTNLFLPLALVGALCLQVLGVYVPELQELLGTHGLPAGQLLLVIALALVPFGAARWTLRWGPPRVGRRDAEVVEP